MNYLKLLLLVCCLFMQLYIMLMSVFGLCMVAIFFFRCVGQNFDGCDGILPGPLAFILTLFGVFEGFLFSLFTCIMFCSQVHAIATDETVSWKVVVFRNGRGNNFFGEEKVRIQ